MKMIWGCAAVLAVAVVLSTVDPNTSYLLLTLKWTLMMGAMVLTMGGLRGSGGAHKR
jgi:hypothetical protein